MSAKILIIERETSFLTNLILRLESEQYTVFSSCKESEIKKLIKRRGIDVILLCLMELKREGLGLLSMMKKLRPFIEVIILNDPDQIGLSIEGMKLGAFDDFLVPFDTKLLLNRIQEAVLRKEERMAKRESLAKRIEKTVMAISFAEAGEHETAKEYLKSRKKK
jgi:DNA-binding NtrC family response regulator